MEEEFSLALHKPRSFAVGHEGARRWKRHVRGIISGL